MTALDDKQRAAVQAIADAQAKSDDTGMCSVSSARVEVLAVTGDAAHRQAVVMFDYVVSHRAQSGSDWADHYVFAGTVTYEHGAVARSSIALRDKEFITENAEPTYDRSLLVATVRDTLKSR